MAAEQIGALLKSAAWVTTPLSLAALCAALFTWWAAREKQKSLREQITGDKLQGAQIIQVLKIFKDETTRLSALAKILDNDTRASEQIIAKARSGLDLSLNQAEQTSALSARLLVVGGILFSVALVGALLPAPASLPKQAQVFAAKQHDAQAAPVRKPTARLSLVAEREKNVREAIRKLQDTIQNETLLGNGPWATGQYIVALSGETTDQASLSRSLIDDFDKGCGCWRKASLKLSPRGHNAATYWALLGLAILRHQFPSGALAFATTDQYPSGAWGVLPREAHPRSPISAIEQERVASTYITSLAVMALVRAKAELTFAVSDAAAIDRALERAGVWLLRKREPGKALWKDFPDNRNGAVSLAISAQAFHALHLLSTPPREVASVLAIREAMPDLSRVWLESLPLSLASLSDSEPKGEVFVDPRSPTEVNDVFQVSSPWVLIATSDAYRFAGADLQTATTEWIDRVFAQFPLDAVSLNAIEGWHASEAVIGLRYLLGEELL
jgi:hypothetical protein